MGAQGVRDSSIKALITPGEPAGIGPELVCQLAMDDESHWVALADPDLMAQRAEALGLALEIQVIDALDAPITRAAGQLLVWPVPLQAPSHPGQLNTANASYVLACLEQAAKFCLQSSSTALVTGPIHKGVINDAGVAFSGHTEFLQDIAQVDRVVMMLTTDPSDTDKPPLRVALVTTHLPLSEVPQAITHERLVRTLEILDQDLKTRFGIQKPRCLVLGLNPHAGEGGHLGLEEQTIITPALESLRAKGWDLLGPVPADTAFVPSSLSGVDAVVAMYHDQGLPVLKYAGFGRAVNITLGLPFVRTSVDHGTALDIAGQGRAEAGSLRSALAQAFVLLSASNDRG